MENPEYQPKFLQAILLLLLYIFVFTLVPGLFIMSLAPVLGFKAGDMLVESITAIAGLILLIFWIYRRYRIDFKALLQVKFLKIRYLPPMLAMIAGAVIIISEIDNLLRIYMPLNEHWAKVFKELATSSGEAGFWKFFLYAVLVAPVVEEILYRGIILKGFLKHYPPHRAIAVSAILFGIAHLNPWQFWPGVIWGGIAGWWFYGTRSLVPCLVGHSLINVFQFIPWDVCGIKIPGFNTGFQTVTCQPFWFDLLGIGLLALGIIILAKMLSHRVFKKIE